MTDFQFDESFDDKRLINDCNAEGLCVAKRYPSRLKGKKDFEILPIVMAGRDPFVTFDGRIIDEHPEYVPPENPGIVIVRLRRPSKTMTSRIARHLLSRFKACYGGWSTETWRGIRLEITETGVFISNSCPAVPGSQAHIEYESPSFTEAIEGILKVLAEARANASTHAAAPSPTAG